MTLQIPPAIPIIAFLLLLILLVNEGDDSVAAVSSSPSVPFWSTYRPNLYYGVRCRHPSSPLFGFGWSGPFDKIDRVDAIRIDAEERDKVEKYGFTIHDAQTFAKQEILDPLQFINLTTKFIPLPHKEFDIGSLTSNNKNENSWISTIDAQPLKTSKPVNVSLFWFLSLMDGKHKILSWAHDESTNFLSVKIDTGDDFDLVELTVKIHSAGHPNIKLWTKEGLTGVKLNEPIIYGIRAPQPWESKTIIRNGLVQTVNDQYRFAQKFTATEENKNPQINPKELFAILPNDCPENANTFNVQHIVTLPAKLEFIMKSIKKSNNDNNNNNHHHYDSNEIDLLTAELEQKFHNNFNAKFPISNENHRRVGRAALSNLLGSIGYFHGSSLIETDRIEQTKDGKKKRIRETKSTKSLSLLTGSPSRSFFPRGFLWDEGFHLLLTSYHSLPLAIDILDSWLSQILPSGWLPREQILGEEARRRVPSEFQVQKPNIANPPTLILTLGRIVQRINERINKQSKQQMKEMTVEINSLGESLGSSTNNNEEIFSLSDSLELEGDIGQLTKLLIKHFNSLQNHVDWYWKTQSPIINDKKTNRPSMNLSSAQTFRWSGRSIGHCLASGLDDYPRASWIPNKNDGMINGTNKLINNGESFEGHVDLHSWMIALTQTMSQISQFLTKYAPPINHDNNNSDKNETSLSYESLSSAYSAKSRQLLSVLNEYHWNSDRGLYCDYAYRRGVRHWICHAGYVGFFPLMLGHVKPSSSQFDSLLTHLRDVKGVWSDWGIRSLSQSDILFGSGEDYWRGHIWFNMNYLLVQALAQYKQITKKTGEEEKASIIDRVISALTGDEDENDNNSANNDHSNLLTHMSPLSFTDEDDANVGRSLHNTISSTYRSLRRSLIDNVVRVYDKQGFLYEQYNATSGRGQRSHPFTGWTALVVNLMSEKY